MKWAEFKNAEIEKIVQRMIAKIIDNEDFNLDECEFEKEEIETEKAIIDRLYRYAINKILPI
jgi:hypothetical protein